VCFVAFRHYFAFWKMSYESRHYSTPKVQLILVPYETRNANVPLHHLLFHAWMEITHAATREHRNEKRLYDGLSSTVHSSAESRNKTKWPSTVALASYPYTNSVNYLHLAKRSP